MQQALRVSIHLQICETGSTYLIFAETVNRDKHSSSYDSWQCGEHLLLQRFDTSTQM